MRFGSFLIRAALLCGIALVGLPLHVYPEDSASGAGSASAAALPDAPSPQMSDSQDEGQPTASGQGQAGPKTGPDAAAKKPVPPPQPKRILGVMPNYRAVSADVLPPPPTPREAFVIATQDTFDYSAFVFVGITSLLAEGDGAHPQLGKGVPGFWAYYWRGFLDKAGGNYLVVYAFPTVLHEDERYYAMGEGGIWKRGVYSATRVLITPNYQGKNVFNAAEILGRGISQAISLTYYPSQTQTASGYTAKFAYAVGRDALTNVFREFWPDISAHVLHRHK